ncbi:MalY/PatB family protein [Isobaculum melis]|uniref:cysteine-S-conjugate beta-lyase n=1 Tax=Isobaculum melis TaxID=142588 RepID=A0A1H9TIZ6_9LACT|nr:MalY/PatB family protein [Isobaculum melis]SER96593.1 cystathione beta-lyase [Isobaculum melis]
MYNFDQIILRKGTNSKKWDSIDETYHEAGLLPMWVADMDFATPDFIREAIAAALDHKVLGYTMAPESLYEAIIQWEATQHQIQLKKEHILFSPGVVPSIALAIETLTQVEEAVMIHDPVYTPFREMVEQNNRKVITSTLTIENGQFVMDFKDIEKKFSTEKVRLFILSNPQNPGGRVWSRGELNTLLSLCKKYQVYCLSDEIHSDLIFAPHQFTSAFAIDEAFDDLLIVLNAATKTFNMAGVKHSMIYVKDSVLRAKLMAAQAKSEQGTINTFGYAATEAAYRYGKDWLKELIGYIQENQRLFMDFFAKELPHISVIKPEGTYLIWIDCRSLGLSDQTLKERLIHQGKIVLSPGIDYGLNGSGWMRVNLGCPKEILEDGLQRLKLALAK